MYTCFSVVFTLIAFHAYTTAATCYIKQTDFVTAFHACEKYKGWIEVSTCMMQTLDASSSIGVDNVIDCGDKGDIGVCVSAGDHDNKLQVTSDGQQCLTPKAMLILASRSSDCRNSDKCGYSYGSFESTCSTANLAPGETFRECLCNAPFTTEEQTCLHACIGMAAATSGFSDTCSVSPDEVRQSQDLNGASHKPTDENVIDEQDEKPLPNDIDPAQVKQDSSGQDPNSSSNGGNAADGSSTGSVRQSDSLQSAASRFSQAPRYVKILSLIVLGSASLF